MSVEIPPKFEFEHLLAHTFPGFFSAITPFMLIDYWSPLDLTSLDISDLNGLVSFAGFILLIGSILGIITDGIYHSIKLRAAHPTLKGGICFGAARPVFRISEIFVSLLPRFPNLHD